MEVHCTQRSAGLQDHDRHRLGQALLVVLPDVHLQSMSSLSLAQIMQYCAGRKPADRYCEQTAAGPWKAKGRCRMLVVRSPGTVGLSFRRTYPVPSCDRQLIALSVECKRRNRLSCIDHVSSSGEYTDFSREMPL